MEYEDIVAKYIENVRLCEKYRVSVGDHHTKESYINQLVNNNRKMSRLLDENNKILTNLFYDYKNIDLMDYERYSKLKYFAKKLHNELFDEDFGLIFDIYCLLTKYSHLHLDINEQLENEYNLTNLNYYLKLNFYPYHKQAFKGYYNVDDNIYFNVLTKESRSYYIRLKSNMYCGFVCKDIEDVTVRINSIKDVIDFIHRKDVMEYDDFPFDTWTRLILINLNIVISAIREHKYEISEKDKLKLLDLLKYYDLNMRFKNHYSRINYLISYIALLFHLDKINLDQLIDGLYKLLEIKDGATDEQLLATKLRIKNNIIMYLYHYTDDTDTCKKVLNECMDELNFNKKLTNDVVFDRLYQVLAIEGVKLYGFKDYKEQLFQSMILRHSATYIHSSMVKEIASILLNEYLDKNPQLKNKGFEEIINDCAIFHDIGKFYIMPIIKVNHRFLTTCELDQVFLHPEYGLDFLNDVEINDYIKETIQFHHQSYDGTIGYPNKYNSNHSFVVDIIRIADCLDAASDHIGRPFNMKKNFDQVYAEFKALSNKQYAPNIVALLDDSNFRNKLENKIRNYREELYYQKFIENRKVIKR